MNRPVKSTEGSETAMSRRTLLAGMAAAAVGVSATARAVTTKRRTSTTAPRTTKPAPAPTTGSWWADRNAGALRQTITVSAGGFTRTDHPIELDLNGGSTPIAPASVRVIEIDAGGQVVNADVPHQFDRGVSPSLVFLLTGATAASATRRYAVYFDVGATTIPAKPVTARVKLEENQADEGQDGFRVSTRGAAYSYQRKGGSFSSLVDKDGNDWLSYHPEPGAGPNGAGGAYRGMPNFHFPDGNFHPGFEVSDTEVLANGPLRVVLRSTSTTGGSWAYETAFFPDFARSTVTKAASEYWFLYEGTPGGESGRGGVKAFKVLRADGEEYGHRDSWSTKFKDEAWVSFRSPGLSGPYGRSLFLAHNTTHKGFDSYYLAREDGSGVGADDLGSMTVFGFGRDNGKMSLSKDDLPNRFTFGLMEPTDATDAAAKVRGAYRDVSTTTGPIERRRAN